MPRVFDGRLSPGQLAALRLAASGYTSRQIAARLGTTEQGIHLRLKEAANSLGAKSRTHAVVVALARGLIRLEELEVPVRRPVQPQEARERPSAPLSRANSPRAPIRANEPENGPQSRHAAPPTRRSPA